MFVTNVLRLKKNTRILSQFALQTLVTAKEYFFFFLTFQYRVYRASVCTADGSQLLSLRFSFMFRQNTYFNEL